MENTPSKIDFNKLEIKPLSPDLDGAAFSCGHKSIDNFFRNNAREYHDKHKVRVYVAIRQGHVVGYYYLVAQSIPPEEVSQESIRKFGRVNATPCV